jgi:hypothetical protein
LFDPITHFIIGCTLFASPWASSEWALIDYGLRQTTRLTDQTGSASCAIFERLRLRSTSSSIARFTTRSEDGSTVFSESSKHLAVSLGTLTRDAWPYTCRRPSVFCSLILQPHPHPRPTPTQAGSLPFLRCSHLGAPSDRWIAIMSLTPDQCGPRALFLLP